MSKLNLKGMDLRMAKAKTFLILKHPFISTILLKIPLVSDERVPTACTNGQWIKYNPKWLDSLTDEMIVGLLAHEVYHIVLMHPLRLQHRVHEKFNRAGDMVVNAMLKESGFDLPMGGLFDKRYGADKGAEWVYDQLPDLPPKKVLAWGDFEAPTQEDGQELSDSEISAIENDTKIVIQQAANAAKAQGKLPAGLERLVGEIIEPKISWCDYVRKTLLTNRQEMHTWSKPKKRYVQSGVYLPSMFGRKCGLVVVAIDTSGSIGQDLLDKFAGEASGVIDDLDCDALVVYCDAEINKTEAFSKEDLPLKLKAVGGGGTDFRPVFKHLEENEINPEAIIYLTDTYGDFPEPIDEPECAVYWVTGEGWGNPECAVPFGDLLVMRE